MKKQIKPKMIITNYEKKFESFERMVEALKLLHPEMEIIFKYADEEVTHYTVADDVLLYFRDNMPNISEGVNLPVSVSISTNRVNLKTAKYFSLGWNFRYDREGNITDLVAYVSTFGRTDGKNSNELEDMKVLLNDNAWYIVER